MKKLLALCFAALFAANAQAQVGITGYPVFSGTWTPALQFGGASTGITYGTQSGTYVKIDKQVIAEFKIILTSKGSATGAPTITGLPFTSNALSGDVRINYYQDLVSGTASFASGIYGAVPNASTSMAFWIPGVTSSNLALDQTNFSNISQLYGIAVYQVP